MSQRMQIDVKREGVLIRVRFSKPVPGDDPELVRVSEFEIPIVQALMLAAGIVTESVGAVQTAFTIANSALLARAKKAPPEPAASEATGAKEEEPAQ